MKKLLQALLLSLLASASYGQLTSCTQTLRLARSTYEQGRLHEIPALLSRCLENGFSQSEKVEAYKLLCLSYIYLEEPEKADEAMLHLLRTDHYFEINASTDPAEFIALYKTFRTAPIYRFGGKIGANASLPNVVSYVPANEGISKYTYGIGVKAGLAAEIPLKKNFTLSPELNFVLKKFNYENKATYIESASGEEREFKTTSTENQSWISLPISVQYQLMTHKFHPYVSLGLSADYLLSAKNNFQRSKENATALEEQSLNITSERNPFNMSALASIGAKWKVSGGLLIAEIRYGYGLTKVNSKEHIYSLPDKTLPTSGYVDGIFKMNTFSVTVGYVYNIFNPRKLKR